MIRILLLGICAGCLLLSVSCSKRDGGDSDNDDWTDIQALDNQAVMQPAGDASTVPADGRAAEDPDAAATAQPVPDDEFTGFARRLATMKTVRRESGETLLTGDSLVFDYEARFVRMDGAVVVADDQGILETESLVGRFSESNQVEYIEASGGVSVVSGGRTAGAETALYNYLDGMVQMDGQAEISENGDRLSGERIRFWISGDRRMICEPNAVLVVGERSGSGEDGMPEEIGDTEIRANQIIYDESRHRVDILGNVRLRNPQVAMNCDEIHLFLKDNNEIDWIEAVSEVIIQSEDRKALADRARYDADEGKFTLEGSPMVTQGRSVMTGDRIFIWPETRGAVCENARALLYLDDETKEKLLKDLND